MAQQERYAVAWARSGDVHEMVGEPVVIGGPDGTVRDVSLPRLFYWGGGMWRSDPAEADLHGSREAARRVIATMNLTSHMAVRTVIDARVAY